MFNLIPLVGGELHPFAAKFFYGGGGEREIGGYPLSLVKISSSFARRFSPFPFFTNSTGYFASRQ
jgi:hypothetical protein